MMLNESYTNLAEENMTKGKRFLLVMAIIGFVLVVNHFFKPDTEQTEDTLNKELEKSIMTSI
ncbi:hypothetical protein [Virgibacillus pantothenticus]|uniref:hypothetical protein n=1 Tax=Virgibacillus pantothenticus TaxID=1473 RepID=UPI001BAFC8A9|nr:hypothetical protein [Virgibacillus pantothenticus]